jgi:cation:H+ antiporter
MVVVSLLSLLLFTAGVISRPTGFLLCSALVGYTGFNVWLARRQASKALHLEFEAGIPTQTKSLIRDILFIAAGLGLLVGGSRLLIVAATDIARVLGINEAVIGLTVVAAGTSLPELATSVTAALRRQADIAVGNVIGSNIFNLLGILGAASMVSPIYYHHIESLNFWVMIGFSVVLLPLLWSGRKLQRWEGAVLLSGYAGYLYVLWPSG